jgi:hypothetical protein
VVEPVPGSVRFSLVFEPEAAPIATSAIARTIQVQMTGQ